MLTEIRHFIWEALTGWADWSTGKLVLAIALVKLLRSRDFRKKTWIAIFGFFLFMGVFSAWESQKQNRIKAESERDGYKGDAHYNQQRIDKLQDALLTVSNGSNSAFVNQSTNVSVKNNSDNVVIGAPYSINATGGSNSLTINGPKPFISAQSPVAVGMLTNGVYQSSFVVQVANPPREERLLMMRYPFP